MATGTEIQPTFLPSDSGAIYVVEHIPAVMATRGHVLFIPPFGEEMNRARRAMHVTAERLAQHGYVCALFDYYGTGDSDGDLPDATLGRWTANVETVRNWICRDGRPLDACVGVRFGALVAFAALQQAPVPDLVLWQPVTNGDRYLRSLFRQSIISEKLRGSATTESVDDLVRRAEFGEPVETGGYLVSAQFAQEISRLTLTKITIDLSVRIHWLETPVSGATQPSEEIADSGNALRTRGHEVRLVVCPGPPFWSMTEPEIPTAVIDETVRTLNR